MLQGFTNTQNNQENRHEINGKIYNLAENPLKRKKKIIQLDTMDKKYEENAKSKEIQSNMGTTENNFQEKMNELKEEILCHQCNTLASL